jgi:hypothetical protein
MSFKSILEKESFSYWFSVVFFFDDLFYDLLDEVNILFEKLIIDLLFFL